jgi:hypothetical protein
MRARSSRITGTQRTVPAFAERPSRRTIAQVTAIPNGRPVRRSGGDSLTSKDMRFFMVKALAKWRLQYADA